MRDGSYADFSDQAHVYLLAGIASRTGNNPYRFMDIRSFKDVKTKGLNPLYNVLDRIKPLSYVIIHEVGY
jgi:hypothetical protein